MLKNRKEFSSFGSLGCKTVVLKWWDILCM